MLFIHSVIGAIIGAIAWPLMERTTDESARAMLGAVFGAVVGGALAWAQAGALIATAIGAVLGASSEPNNPEMEQALVNTFIQIVEGAALGAVALLAISTPSRVVTGAIIGTLAGAIAGVSLTLGLNRVWGVDVSPELLLAGVGVIVLAVFVVLSMRQ